MRRIHRPIPTSPSSSSDEEDVFAALSEKKRKHASLLTVPTSNSSIASATAEGAQSSSCHDNSTPVSATNPLNKPLVATDTSSNKRHHHMSTERAAKLDALLQELKADASSVSTVPNVSSSSYVNDGFVPIKKGSFVEAGEELNTTNIFVGNLDPSVTEEMLTDLFRQFGENMFSSRQLVVALYMPRSNLVLEQKNVCFQFSFLLRE